MAITSATSVYPLKNFISRPLCPLCHDDNKQVIFSRPYTDPSVMDFLVKQHEGKLSHRILAGATYEIARCRRCHALWQTQILNDQLTDLLYDDWVSAAASLRKKTQGKAKLFRDYAHEMEAITRLFPDKRPDEISVLDYGMGWGYWCVMAKAFNFNATGFELSRQRVAYAKKNLVNVADSNSQLEQQKFDFINMESVLEHLPDPLACLEQMAKLLNPGGIIRLGCPDGRYMERHLRDPKWQASDDNLCPLMHLVCFKRSNVLHMAHRAGLSYFYHPALCRHWKIFYKHHFSTAIYVKRNK